MNLGELKELLIEISTCFYQEKVKEGLEQLELVISLVLQVPEFGDCVAPLLDAVQNKDYVQTADIFYYEMALRIQ